MGSACSCFKNGALDSEQLTITKHDKKVTLSQDSTALSFPSYKVYSKPSIIKLQSFIRGFIERKKLASQIRSHKRTESDFNSRSIMDLVGSSPNYSNPNTISTAKMLGRFRFQKHLQDDVKVIKRGPVQIEGGAVYIGE